VNKADQLSTRLSDFSKILYEEAVFPQNFDNGTHTGVPQDVFFVFLMQFWLRRVAPFVSSPILSFVMIDLNATKLDDEARVRRRLGFAPANTITTSIAPRKIWYRAANLFYLYLLIIVFSCYHRLWWTKAIYKFQKFGRVCPTILNNVSVRAW